MKQGKIFMRVILILLLAGIVGLLAFTAVSNLTNGTRTATIYECEVGDSCSTDGYLVRREEQIHSVWPINVLTREEGEKVAAGQSVCSGYQTAAIRERQAEAEELRERIAQLQYANTKTGNSEQQQTQLYEALSTFAVACNGNWDKLDGAASQIRGQTLRYFAKETDQTLLEQQITSAETRLQELMEQISDGSTAVTIPHSGWFSSHVDGYESVLTPELLETMTIRELQRLKAESPTEGTVGRLCLDETWYFACTVPEAYLADAAEEDTVSVSFSGVSSGAIRMVIERIGDTEDGQRLLILRSRRYLSLICGLRSQNARISFSTYKGLRVPKNAIDYVDGKAGVYVVESSYMRWKPVKLLYDNGDSYVVEQDKTDTASLWAGDEVILGGRDLYDGKVVK